MGSDLKRKRLKQGGVRRKDGWWMQNRGEGGLKASRGRKRWEREGEPSLISVLCSGWSGQQARLGAEGRGEASEEFLMHVFVSLLFRVHAHKTWPVGHCKLQPFYLTTAQNKTSFVLETAECEPPPPPCTPLLRLSTQRISALQSRQGGFIKLSSG